MKNTNPNQMSVFELEKLENPRLSDRDAVRAICDRLLAESGVAPPVNVGLLASMRGIAHIHETAQSPAGMLVHRNGQMVAYIREGDSPPRKRFTILHEAGHTLLPGYVEAPQYRCAGPRTLEEQLCDHAASELLFPRASFAPDLITAGFGTEPIAALADGYQGSIEATAVRGVELWPDDALLLVLRVAHKPAEAGREEQFEPKLASPGPTTKARGHSRSAISPRWRARRSPGRWTASSSRRSAHSGTWPPTMPAPCGSAPDGTVRPTVCSR